MRISQGLFVAAMVTSIFVCAEQINEQILTGRSNQASNQTGLTNVYGPSIETPTQSQRAGDIALGVILFDNGSRLQLDGDPCNKRIYYFKAPYSQHPTGQKIPCGKQVFDEYRVKAD